MSLSFYNKIKNSLRKYRYLQSYRLEDIPPHSNSLKTNKNSIELFDKGISVVEPEIVKKKINNIELLSQEIDNLDISEIKKDLISNYKGRKEYKLSLKNYIDENLVNEILNSNFLVEIIKQYFNTDPILNYYDIWMDIPTNQEEKLTQLYHRDYDNKFLVKIFIYLNDVTIDHGPFCYVETSHKDPWNLYKGKNRLNDVEKNYLYDSKYSKALTGKKFTLVLADTNGLHKGLKPKNERLLLTAMYISKDIN